METKTDELDAAKMFTLLGNPVVEIRAIPRDRSERPETQFFDDPDAFAETATGLSFHTEGSQVHAGVYMTINRIRDDIAQTRLTAFDARAIGKQHIDRYTTLFVDIDPERDHPDGGKVCANDKEHKVALDAAQQIREFTDSLGWAAPLMMDSGSGAYLFYRIDLPNSPESQQLVTDVLKSLASNFSSPTYHIDTCVGDPQRIARIAGSYNRKSPHTDDRPNRVARILDAPEELGLVTEDELRNLVGSSSKSQDEVPSQEDQHSEKVDAVLRYLKHLNIQPTNLEDKGDFTLFEFEECLIQGASHRDGRNMGILVWQDGSVAVKCFHEKHHNATWADVQDKLGLSFDEFLTQGALSPDGSDRNFHDPLLLAQKHLAASSSSGEWTYTFFLGDTYCFDDVDGWQKTNEKEQGPWIRETIQTAFDEHAKRVSQIRGEREKPKSVRKSQISDTFQAIQQLCKRDISISEVPPFWLKPHDDWQADDLLCFNNGILNIRRYLEDKGCFIPPTPSLFSEHRATFDFKQSAAEPTEWLRFLETLDQDDDWYTLLQQMMGYSLWLGYDLQKLFQIVGPRRSGKGTITKVLIDLLGGPPAVCSPGLEQFADDFGLEQAIGKRLALIPEAAMPTKKVAHIVSRLKAITGGDMVTVCRKHKPNIPMRLRMKIWMVTNNFLALPDNSGALHARLIPIKLKKSFFGNEDFELGVKLTEEYPGILNWSLEGLRSLYDAKGRFTIPESTQQDLDQLFAESAPLQSFVDECCVVDMSKGVHAVALYEVYKKWGGDLTELEFASELRTTVPTVQKDRASTENQRERKRCQIIQTPFDDDKKRPQLWLGICPKSEWRKSAR